MTSEKRAFSAEIWKFQKIGQLSKKSDNFPKNRKAFQETGNDSEFSESDTIYRARAQTSQTNQTPQTLQTAHPPTQDSEERTEGGKNFFEEEDIWYSQEKVELEHTEEYRTSSRSDSQQAEVSEYRGETEQKTLEEEGTQVTEVNLNKGTPRAENNQNSQNKLDKPQKLHISDDLAQKLQSLQIPLDSQVRRAIASHHLSQAYGALSHIEETRGTVKNPRSIFLYQLPKQPIQQTPKETNSEFLQWYEQAIADGIVQDILPNYLSLDSHNEPLVRFNCHDPITNSPYTLEKWRDVRDGKVADYATPEQAKEFFEGNRSFIEELKAKASFRTIRW